LNPSSDSVRGLDVIQEHFTAGETGPMTVLLAARTDWASPEGRELIDHLSRGFELLPNVAEVRSLTQPLGVREPGAAEPGPAPQPSGIRLVNFLQKVQSELGETVEDVKRRMAEEHYVA